MSIIDIRIALETRLTLMAEYLGDDKTQWENTKLDPPTSADPTVENEPYQSVYLLPAEPANPEMGGYVQEQGFMQVTLRYPANRGTGDAAAMAKAVQDWFYKGLPLAANGTTVTIIRTPTIAPGAVEGDRYSVPVKIRYIADNAN